MLRSTRLNAKIFELRVYTMLPSGFPKYLDLTNQLLHLRTAHSKLCGFWLTELGGQNEVIHIWEYENLMHRKRVRDALSADKEWMHQYIAEVRPCWLTQQNWILQQHETLDGIPMPEGGGNVTIPFYRLRLGQVSTVAGDDNVQRLATFSVICGDGVGRCVTLDGADDLDLLLEKDISSVKAPIHTRIMLRSPWSGKLGCKWQ